jgi:dTDP-4-amino-4,6-dideoxygalactose transaminase
MGSTTGAEATVAFLDLSRAIETLRDELDAAIERVLDSGRLLLGEETASFEREFAAAVGTQHAVGVASGTDALELALRALGIRNNDEVVTQANTCVPTVAAILRVGARPVLCDVEPDAGTMDPASLAASIGPQTRAVIAVHLYGQCADMDAILEVAADRRLAVLEDCAQAICAKFRGRNAGTIGATGCFSFYPTKNLAALGDAGAVVTDDAELAAKVRRIRQYGQGNREGYAAIGVNSRIDELQAAVLRVRLPRLEGWHKRRAEIARHYSSVLRNSSVQPLTVLGDRDHAFHLFVVKAPDRERFRSSMRRRGIDTLVHYPAPIHAYAPYRDRARLPVALEVAERLCEAVVSLPLHPDLTDEEVDRVAEAARASA